MSTDNLTQILTQAVENLPQPESLKELSHQHRDGDSLPSGRALKKTTGLSCSILSRSSCGEHAVNIRILKYHNIANTGRPQHLHLPILKTHHVLPAT